MTLSLRFCRLANIFVGGNTVNYSTHPPCMSCVCVTEYAHTCLLGRFVDSLIPRITMVTAHARCIVTPVIQLATAYTIAIPTFCREFSFKLNFHDVRKLAI